MAGSLAHLQLAVACTDACKNAVHNSDFCKTRENGVSEDERLLVNDRLTSYFNAKHEQHRKHTGVLRRDKAANLSHQNIRANLFGRKEDGEISG